MVKDAESLWMETSQNVQEKTDRLNRFSKQTRLDINTSKTKVMCINATPLLRMDQDHIPKSALRLTPPGKRRQGKPKTTWRRTVMAELNDIGLTRGEAKLVAKDRSRWKQIVGALCPT